MTGTRRSLICRGRRVGPKGPRRDRGTGFRAGVTPEETSRGEESGPGVEGLAWWETSRQVRGFGTSPPPSRLEF